jgi:NAD(P)-dependent dehydrogenase (short-subunit alcohol dehydrogenase family)
MSNVIVVVGPGLIGQAIARRVSAGKRVLLADLRVENGADPRVREARRRRRVGHQPETTLR